MENLIMLIFMTAPFSILFILFFLVTTGHVLLKVTIKIIFESPLQILKTIGGTLLGIAFGYIRHGSVPVEIALYGVTGFIVYLLFLLVSKDYIDL